jgi:hypothetical protein
MEINNYKTDSNFFIPYPREEISQEDYLDIINQSK